MSVPFGAADRLRHPQLETLAGELAKHIKSEQDITALSRKLLQLTVESALKAKLDEHLGYERHAAAGRCQQITAAPQAQRLTVMQGAIDQVVATLRRAVQQPRQLPFREYLLAPVRFENSFG